MKEELKTISAKVTKSGWDLIDESAKEYLCGVGTTDINEYRTF